MSFTISNFNGGLFSSYLRGRPELEKYHNALQDVANYHLLPFGALQNRAGTEFVADEQSTDMRLITFQYNITQSYVLVLFNNKIKIIKDDEIIGSGGIAGAFGDAFSTAYNINSSEYALVSPWDNSQVHGVQYVQVADTMYLVHPDTPPQKLVRYGDDDWALTAIDYSTGPFLPYNLTSTTLTASAATGSGITLTASAGTFIADDVGRTVEIKQTRTDNETSATGASSSAWIRVKGKWSFSTRGVWTGTCTIDRRVNGGSAQTYRSYQSTDDNNFLSDGEEFDDNVEMRVTGVSGITAELVVEDYFTYGVIEITGYTSDTVVTGDVLVDLNDTTASTDWSFNAFSATTGYPTAIALWNERMCLGGTLNQPNTIFLSKIDEWENYQSSNNALDALNFKLNTSENIVWMEEQGDLIIGTSGNEYKLGPQRSDEAFGGDNAQANKEGAEGSTNIQALVVSDVLMFNTRDGKRIKTIGYNFEADKLKARDLNALSGNELMASGVKQMAYKQNPYSELYFVLNDGDVALMTYEQEQNVFGWSRFTTDGNYKSACVLKGVDDDTVYFAVEREVAGSEVIMIEKMKDRDFENQTDWFFVDAGITTQYEEA